MEDDDDNDDDDNDDDDDDGDDNVNNVEYRNKSCNSYQHCYLVAVAWNVFPLY